MGLAIVARVISAAVTPLGPDFVALLLGAAVDDPAVTNGPTGAVTRLVLSAWLALPIQHADIVQTFRAASFQWSPTLFVLVILVKSPLILLDLLSALIIYRLVQAIEESDQAAKAASLLWLLNPYVIFSIEMWGSTEILAIALALLAFWLTVSHKIVIGSLAFAAAIAAKLFPASLLVAPIKASLHRGSVRWAALQFLFGLVGVSGYFVWSSRVSVDTAARFAVYNPQTFVFDEFTISTSVVSVGLATVALALTWLIVIYLWQGDSTSLMPACLAATLAYLAFYNWPPAGLLWLSLFLALVKDDGGLRRGGYLLLLSGALFVLFSSYDVIASPKALFFVPTTDAGSIRVVEVLKQFSSDLFVQSVILPLLRAFFTALSCVLAISLHMRRGVTPSRIATELQVRNSV